MKGEFMIRRVLETGHERLVSPDEVSQASLDLLLPNLFEALEDNPFSFDPGQVLNTGRFLDSGSGWPRRDSHSRLSWRRDIQGGAIGDARGSNKP